MAAVAGCAPAMTPDEANRILAANGLTRADVFECRYQASAVSDNTPGLIMPYAVHNHLMGQCLEARAARNAEMAPPRTPVLYSPRPVTAAMCGPEVTNPQLRAECNARGIKPGLSPVVTVMCAQGGPMTPQARAQCTANGL
jgi:hypothetical protein